MRDLLTTNSSPDFFKILFRFPELRLWNWINLLVFNVANQRLPKSIVDPINKPWRPLPSKRISPNEIRRFLPFLVPCDSSLISWLGGIRETVAMLVLTWRYNDLGGTEESYAVFNLINACGFMYHGSGSTILAAGFEDHQLIRQAYIWLATIGGVVFTTL